MVRIVFTARLHPAGSHRVVLSLSNETDSAVVFAGPRVGVPEFDGSFFQFDPGGVSYRGRSVKRAFYPPGEIMLLNPGEEKCYSVDLALLYRNIPAGARVRYVASHPVRDGGAAPTVPVVSDWVVL